MLVALLLLSDDMVEFRIMWVLQLIAGVPQIRKGMGTSAGGARSVGGVGGPQADGGG